MIERRNIVDLKLFAFQTQDVKSINDNAPKSLGAMIFKKGGAA
jgi:hypothetical protein